VSLDILRALITRIEMDRNILARHAAYYAGTQGLQGISRRVNVSRAVVDRVAERLAITGFRRGQDPHADDQLWDLWQRSGMDRASKVANRTALVESRCYALVWGDGNGGARITIESGRQAYVAHDPATGGRVAGVRTWTERPPDAMPDTYGTSRATLLLPDTVEQWSANGSDTASAGWQLVDSQPNPLGVVPMVRLAVGGGLLDPDGTSVLADVEPLSDALDEFVDGMITTSAWYATPRRYVLGQLPTDAEGNVDTESALAQTVGSVWWLENVESVGTFPAGDLVAYASAIEKTLSLVSTVTGLPATMLGLGSEPNLSGDAVRAAEASLSCRARDCQVSLGEAWEEVVRLAVLVSTGVAPADLDSLETVWADPETRTVAAQVDGVAKLVAVGVPLTVALSEVLGWTPAQIDQVRQAKRADALDGLGVDLAGVLA
jgi:hypothetical protein